MGQHDKSPLFFCAACCCAVSFKAICVRQQLLGDDHEELLVSIEKYVPAPRKLAWAAYTCPLVLSTKASRSLALQLLSRVASCSASLHDAWCRSKRFWVGCRCSRAVFAFVKSRHGQHSTPKGAVLSTLCLGLCCERLCCSAAVRPEPGWSSIDEEESAPCHRARRSSTSCSATSSTWS